MTSLTTAARRNKLRKLTPAQLKRHSLVQVGPNSWAGPCPKCGGEDRLTVNISKGVLYCRNCKPSKENPAAFDAILEALTVDADVLAIGVGEKFESAYTYRDAAGTVVNTVTVSRTEDGGKRVSQTPGAPRPHPLYRLSAVLKAKRRRVVIVEGEKCRRRLA